jgi:hypothetical protein
MADRSHTLQVRFNPDELSILDEVAAEWKTTRAGAIRRMADEQLRRIKIDRAKLRKLTGEFPDKSAD